jgi:hypothetical protein
VNGCVMWLLLLLLLALVALVYWTWPSPIVRSA